MRTSLTRINDINVSLYELAKTFLKDILKLVTQVGKHKCEFLQQKHFLPNLCDVTQSEMKKETRTSYEIDLTGTYEYLFAVPKIYPKCPSSLRPSLAIPTFLFFSVFLLNCQYSFIYDFSQLNFFVDVTDLRASLLFFCFTHF